MAFFFQNSALRNCDNILLGFQECFNKESVNLKRNSSTEYVLRTLYVNGYVRLNILVEK